MHFCTCISLQTSSTVSAVSLCYVRDRLILHADMSFDFTLICSTKVQRLDTGMVVNHTGRRKAHVRSPHTLPAPLHVCCAT